MGRESPLNYLSELVVTNPVSSDGRTQGDDHIRGIKRVLKNTFPNFEGSSTNPKSVTKTEDEINNAVFTDAENTWTGAQYFEGDDVILGNLYKSSGTVSFTEATLNAQGGLISQDGYVLPIGALLVEFNGSGGITNQISTIYDTSLSLVSGFVYRFTHNFGQYKFPIWGSCSAYYPFSFANSTDGNFPESILFHFPKKQPNFLDLEFVWRDPDGTDPTTDWYSFYPLWAIIMFVKMPD